MWVLIFAIFVKTTKICTRKNFRFQKNLPPLDPFAKLCPLMEAFQLSGTLSLTCFFSTRTRFNWRAADETDDESSECDELAEENGNAFDMFS